MERIDKLVKETPAMCSERLTLSNNTKAEIQRDCVSDRVGSHARHLGIRR